jgi:hypothetical protein
MPEKVAGWVGAEGPGRGSATVFERDRVRQTETERERESWREAGRKEMGARKRVRASERAKEI